MRKPSREALTKRIWFDYFNEVLRKQNLIDWNTYQKIKLSIQTKKPSFRWTFSTDWGIQKGALFSFLQAMYSPLCFCPVRI